MKVMIVKEVMTGDVSWRCFSPLLSPFLDTFFTEFFNDFSDNFFTDYFSDYNNREFAQFNGVKFAIC